jgi:hypothetical protein
LARALSAPGLFFHYARQAAPHQMKDWAFTGIAAACQVTSSGGRQGGAYLSI